MKILATLTVAMLLSSGFAFADESPTVCLTINRPTKWSAGLVLKIFTSADGSRGAQLLSLPMFRGISSESSTGQGLGSIDAITVSKTDAGETTYVGGADGSKLNAVLSAPNEIGGMTGSIDIELADMTIHAKSASITRFSGPAKCE